MDASPQFPYEGLYISPFTQKRRYDEDGNVSYIPLERNLRPSGIRLLDGFALQLANGLGSRGAYCRRTGITTTQLDVLFQLLTGISADGFRTYFRLRTADDLLRYTDMEVREVARRSGLGTSTNLFYTFRRELRCSATDRRYALRKKGDLGRYKL